MKVLALHALTALVQSAAPPKLNLNVVGGEGQMLPTLNVARTCTSDVVYPTVGFTESVVVAPTSVKACAVAGTSAATTVAPQTRLRNFADIAQFCTWTLEFQPGSTTLRSRKNEGK